MLVAQGVYEGKLVTVKAEIPAFTVTANSNQTGVRAFLVGQDSALGRRPGDSHRRTITGSPAHNLNLRAFLVNGTTNGYGSAVSVRDGQERFLTVTAENHKTLPRAFVAGRVVRMTPRALARFQSVPDDYQLPNNAALACKVIGNGVPCLLSQRLVESVINLRL